VPKQQNLGWNLFENCLTRFARRRFRPLAASHDLDAAHGERHAQTLAQLSAESGPRVRVRAQAVINMDGPKRKLPLGENMQKHNRINAARQADGDALALKLELPDRCRELSARSLP
jgi:hypothetical protein